MKNIYTLITTIIVLSVIGCKPSFVISEKNYQEHQFQVASAQNEYSLDMATTYDALYQSDVLNLGGVLDTNIVREFIDSLVLDSMIGLEANEVDLRKYYNDYRIYKLRYNDYLLRQYLKKEVYDKAESDSLEVVEYYYANEELFAIEEQIDLYHIALTSNTLLNSKDSLKFRKLSADELEIELFRLADSIKALITLPEKFPEIAAKFSEDVVGADIGGHLGWTKRGNYLPPFDSIAFELRAGQLGGPYKDENGVHIIMVSEYYPSGLLPINEIIFKTAEKTLNMTKTNKFGIALIDSLLSNYDLVVNPEILDKNVYIVDGQTWGAIINRIDTIDCNAARSIELIYRKKYKVDNTTAGQKKIMFKELGERYVIVQAARNIGLEQDSVIAVYRNELYHKFTRAIVTKRRFDVKWKPSDSSIEEYYTNHLDNYKIEKPINVQHIIFDDSLFAEFVKDQAMSGIDFMELAQEYYPGEKSIRTDLADLGFIGENDVSKEFYDTALKTRIGEVSAPVKTEFGFHIIKVLEVKKAKDLDEAKFLIAPILKKIHKKQSIQEFTKNIFEKYQVQSNGELYPVHLKPKSLRN